MFTVRRMYGAGSYTGSLCSAARRAVTGHAGHADLHADMAITLRHGLACPIHDLRDFVAADAGVAGRRFAHLPAQQLVNGHARLAPLDVPQGLDRKSTRLN